MTNYEKVMKNINSNILAYILYKSNACPFPQYKDCNKCEFYNRGDFSDSHCKFTNMQMKEVMKWLEQEVEE